MNDTGARPSQMGHLASAWIAPAAGAPMVEQTRVEAIADRGLCGDRYGLGRGSFSRREPLFAGARALSLIERRAVDRCNTRLAVTGERSVGAADLRRNLVLDGLDLRAWIGHRLQVGSVVLLLRSTCPPCRLLSRHLGIDARRALEGIGGVRAAVETSGVMSRGDRATVID